ncbi:MAG: hypothetical protein FJ276_27380, partial [Planctomycetes bacterium]|nr:hypothetical protein [Planctomycetota bacterium]
MNRTFANQMLNDWADRPPSDGESSLAQEEPAVGAACGGVPHPGLEQERPSTLLDLAYEQYCQRIERGEQIDIADFCREFPELGSALHRQLMVHDLIDDRMSLWLSCCDAVLPRAGERFLGFQLVEEIGRGAFARVFRATDGELGEREVAVKVCPAGSHEAWIMGRLKHANIVPIYSVRHDAESGLSAICMPYLGQVTLRDLMVSLKKPQTALRADAASGRGSGPPADGESRTRGRCTLSRSRSLVDSALF